MRKKGIALMCAAALLMTGCGTVLPNLTDEEADIIGEYAAIKLLKYDANSRSRLVDLSQVQEKEEPYKPASPNPSVPEESQAEEPPDIPDTPVIDNRVEGNLGADSMESFLDFPEGLSIVYEGYKLCQSYPEEEDQYFMLEASAGKELLVLQFSLQNLSGGTQELNLINRSDSYRLTINGNYAKMALKNTLLPDDLATYKGSLPAGGTKEAALLFEIEPEQMGTVTTLSLLLKNESKTYTIQLQ